MNGRYDFPELDLDRVNDNGFITATDILLFKRVAAGENIITDEDAAVTAYAASSLGFRDIDCEWLLTCSDEEFLTYLLGSDLRVLLRSVR